MKTDGRWLLSGVPNRGHMVADDVCMCSMLGCNGSALYCGRVPGGTC
ncbi:hypothetical protein [Extibacter muris]|nr:hypothetical protein [Extibacter muris]